MPLTELPPSYLVWGAGVSVANDHTLCATAAPTLLKWIRSIQMSRRKMDLHDAWKKRKAILLSEEHSRLGLYLNSLAVSSSRHSTSINVTNRETGLSVTALRAPEGFLLRTLLDPLFSGIDEPTCRVIDRLCGQRMFMPGVRPKYGDIVPVIELGSFGLRLRFVSIHNRLPCWHEAWGTPLEPGPGLKCAEAFQGLMAMAESTSAPIS